MAPKPPSAFWVPASQLERRRRAGALGVGGRRLGRRRAATSRRRDREHRQATGSAPAGRQRELEPGPVARDHPHQRRAGGERDREVAGRVGDVERDPARRERQVAVERLLAAVGDHHREVEQGAVGEAGERRRPRPGPSARAGGRWRAASQAPASPASPQPAICQAVHGPWPSQMLEIGAASAPTAKPGRAAERVAGDQRDVGGRDHVRDRGQHEPAGDRERRQRGDQRDQPRRRPGALVPGEAADEDQRQAGEDRDLPAHRHAHRGRRARSRQRAPRARLGGDRAVAAEDARDLGGEVPAAGEDLVGAARRRSARRRRAARTRSANRAANSTSWVATSTAAPPRRELGEPLDQLGLAGAVHAAGRLVEADDPRASRPSPRPAITIASASRSRSPPERSRGSRRAAHSSPTAASARSAGRARAARRRPARGGRGRPGSAAAARSRAAPRSAPRTGSSRPGRGPQQGALAGAVAAHQRDPLARLDRELERRAARRAPTRPCRARPRGRGPRSAGAARRGGRRRSAAERPGRGCSRLGAASRDLETLLAQGPPRLLRRDRQRPHARRARTAAPPGCASAGSASSAQSPNACGRAVEGEPAAVERDARGRPRPGSARAGARRAPRPSPTPRSAAAAGRSARRRRPGRAARWARRAGPAAGAAPAPPRARPAAARRPRACRSAARAGAAIASASTTSSSARARAAGGSPRSSSGSSSSPRTVAETTWVSGSWPTRPTSAAELGGPVLADVEAADRERARDLAAVVVRDQAAAGAQQASTCPIPSARRGRRARPRRARGRSRAAPSRSAPG